MKIIAFLCTLLIFSFSSSSEVGTNLAGTDIKSCAYSNRNGTLYPPWRRKNGCGLWVAKYPPLALPRDLGIGERGRERRGYDLYLL